MSAKKPAGAKPALIRRPNYVGEYIEVSKRLSAQVDRDPVAALPEVAQALRGFAELCDKAPWYATPLPVAAMVGLVLRSLGEHLEESAKNAMHSERRVA